MLLPGWTVLRRERALFIRLVENPWFDLVSLTVILASVGFMISYQARRPAERGEIARDRMNSPESA